MKHPMLPITVAFAVGILMARWLSVPLWLLFCLSMLLAFAAILKDSWSRWQIWPLLLLTGWTGLTFRTEPLSPHDLRRLAGPEPALATLRGVLLRSPDRRVSRGAETERWRTLAVLEVQAVQWTRDGAWQRAVGRVITHTADRLPERFVGGSRVEVAGVLRVPPGPVAPGLFDYRNWLHWKGITHELRADDNRDWRFVRRVVQPERPPLTDRFREWARAALARGLPTEDEPVRLLRAMTLGLRSELDDEVLKPFRHTGSMHIFAISGLHIALIAAILVALLRVLRLPRAACGWVVAPLLWFYAAATGWQSSAVRATIMMTVVVLGWATARPGNLLNSLAGAAFLILMWEPRQLFQASFQLSFAVVGSIALVLPRLESVVSRWMRTDPFLPADLVPGWRRHLREAIRWLLMAFALSLSAWLGSLPLVAMYFHLITPVGLLTNVGIVHLGGLALASGLGSLACAPWFPGLSELFNHGAWFWMRCAMELCEWAARLPGGWRYVPAPTPVECGVYYALLAGLGTGWLWGKHRAWKLGLTVAVLIVLGFWRWYDQAGRLRITILPASGGAAIYVDAPGHSQDLLVDTGGASDQERVVAPFLRALGVHRLDCLILTHGDQQHTGGAVDLIAGFEPSEVVTSPLRFRSRSYNALIEGFDAAGARRPTIARGDSVAGWKVLHPERGDAYSRADDGVLVLACNFGGVRILLLSDLGEAGQRDLLTRSDKLKADIAVTGLPSQGDPVRTALLRAIDPSVLIVNDARYPAYHRAGKDLRERLAHTGVPVVYGSDSGWVQITARDGGWTVKPGRGASRSHEDPPDPRRSLDQPEQP